MGHYFSFLKDAGKHLDPKTRNLISVITKVHAQTERGFRQYLGRALREGCTPMEVLDALLMAFPALGLAKIVWAVDIILAMDIPEFEPAAMAEPVKQWHDVMAADELASGDVRAWTATAAACSSIATATASASTTAAARTRAPTSRTWRLNGSTLTCPKHEWAFDVHSGECIRKGNSPLRRWESKIVDGRLMALW